VCCETFVCCVDEPIDIDNSHTDITREKEKNQKKHIINEKNKNFLRGVTAT